MFQRVGAVAFKKDLTNTLALCEALGNPQHKFRSIHIAGTNGKGSTSHMLAAILQTSGYKTGLYTSPHLKSFTERIRINGQEVSEEFVVDFVNKIRTVSEQIKPSFFEITVAMAFDYFASQSVDIAVIETGLGGRLDSTNVIVPCLSLITNIGWDHKDLLGDTLEQIAYEKAGIIKEGIPVIISERQEGIANVFITKANEQNASIEFASDSFNATFNDNELVVEDVNSHTRTTIANYPLRGHYQLKNVPGVMAAVNTLRELGFNLNDLDVLVGLQNVTTITGLKGRWQLLGAKPMVLCDTGHNIDGMRAILAQLSTYPFKQLRMVLGMVKDKDVREILSILPKDATYYFCQASIPRAMDANDLLALAKEFQLHGVVIQDVNDALDAARRDAHANDFIFIGGSTFVVAEVNSL